MSRPKSVYLIGRYTQKPRDPRQTFRPGYVKNEHNMQWDERVDVTVGLKDRDLSTSQIILNISEQKVVKNSFMNDKSFMEMFQYYYTSSPQEISQALKNCGISISEHKEQTEDGLQENVSGQAEESARPEPAATADVIGPSEGDKKRRRKPRVSKEPAATTAAGDREPQATTEPSDVSH